MIRGSSNPCYPQGMPIYEEPLSSSVEPNSTHPTFLYNLSILKDRVHQVQSLASIFLAPDHTQPLESTAAAMPTMGTLIQEIIVTASSMMFACQQMSLGPPSSAGTNNNNNNFNNVPISHHDQTNKVVDSSASLVQLSRDHRAFYANHHQGTLNQWYSENYIDNEDCVKEMPTKVEMNEGSGGLLSINNYDIIELDASDLLAKYTHYCQVCGKGFKRDANLRMHMRAHGDEYKSSAALSNPMKNINPKENTADIVATKYSCPQEGCRWNKKHAKFQPLKSMICVKNHYKRSHCPKMYVCKRCNTKQFSVLSDLRTHEKHCGDLKWQCSCGTTFSRKDKLMGHVALFVGHTPVMTSLTRMGESR